MFFQFPFLYQMKESSAESTAVKGIANQIANTPKKYFETK